MTTERSESGSAATPNPNEPTSGEITRYDLDYDDVNGEGVSMHESTSGDYVLYADHRRLHKTEAENYGVLLEEMRHAWNPQPHTFLRFEEVEAFIRSFGVHEVATSLRADYETALDEARIFFMAALQEKQRQVDSLSGELARLRPLAEVGELVATLRAESERMREERDRMESNWRDTFKANEGLANENERLEKRIGDFLAERAADRQRLFDASVEAGMPFWGCDTPEAMADKINDLRADATLGANLRRAADHQFLEIYYDGLGGWMVGNNRYVSLDEAMQAAADGVAR